ncbi:hypothetical protein ACQP25_30940 [Microtetraspora malaysiensis]|uniref:hypothetical protein n=1 Tax=Microtetraspora malaysiensis TaxID=161358 RepID=UPI003D93DBF1
MRDEAIESLRRELKAAEIPTEDRDVFRMNSGNPILSLAPGLVVWTGLMRVYRWAGHDRRWQLHPASDPAGAARLIAPLYLERMPDFDQVFHAGPL